MSGARQVLTKRPQSGGMAETLVHRVVGGEREEVRRSPLDGLANRELEVFHLIGEGVEYPATPRALFRWRANADRLRIGNLVADGISRG